MHNLKNLTSAMILFLSLLAELSFAQPAGEIKMMVNRNRQVIIDYATMIDMNTRVPLRKDLVDQFAAGSFNRSSGAVFEVNYINFSMQQQLAFQYAVDIWSNLLQSDVVINITAQMSPLDPGIIGQTIIPVQFANFPNAQKINSFYVVAMAEKIAGEDLNDPTEPDIILELNSQFEFYFGTNGVTPSGLHDFATVILHEIGHGLGFFDGTFETGGSGFYTVFGAPTVYDRHLENDSSQNIVESFADGSIALGDQLTGDSIFFNGFSFPTAEDRPRLYAPAVWSSGSSISHLDELTYPAGDLNSLMSPQIGLAESIHDPGITYEIFQDLGWVAMDIDFNQLLDTEDSLSDRTITATVKGDSAVLADGVNLYYTYGSFKSDAGVLVNMTSTGNANEYTASIPATGNEETVKYYIEVSASGGKTFTSPGEAPIFSRQFVIAKDTIAPIITHTPIAIAFVSDLVLPIVANVIDNIGVGDLSLIFKINGGTLDTLVVPNTNFTKNGFYDGDYLLDWDVGALGVIAGDIIDYKLDVPDSAANPNAISHPVLDFHKLSIIEISTPVNFYSNDFNSPSDDFTGSGFTIGPEINFDSDAIHSTHPYRTVDGTSNEDSVTLVYLLNTPIIITDKDASMVFDQVVLAEPGVGNSAFGHPQFWDYMVVEGSKNFGLTWLAAADGYDSRLDTAWLDRYNSELDPSGNSTAIGDKSLYRSHEINLTENGNFIAGDTVLLRFRIYVDPFVHAWGWAIDNLKIQVDEKPPVITQITPDYLLVGATSINLRSRVEDNIELDSVIYEIDFKGGTQIISFQAGSGLFDINLTFSQPVVNGDLLKYRIIAVDKAPTPNTAFLPSTGFFEVPVAQFETAQTMYVNDFNVDSDDFIGANFSIRQDNNFTTPALISSTPYPDAPFETGEFTYLLKFPIILNQTSAKVQYDEMVLTQPDVDQVAFEVSKDGGANWIPVIEEYSASFDQRWANLFNAVDSEGNSTSVADPQFIVQRNFDILDNPELTGGDEVLVRFRMTVNSSVNGYGWYIDNLEIQGLVTSIEEGLNSDIQVFPNPTTSGQLRVTGDMRGDKSIITITNLLGKVVDNAEERLINNTLETTLNLQHLQKGIYILSIRSEQAYHTSRIVIE